MVIISTSNAFRYAYRLITALLLTTFILAGGTVAATAQEKDEGGKLRLSGRVVESLGHKDLLKAKVIVTDTLGNLVTDTLIADGGGAWYGDGSGKMYQRAFFNLNVPRKKGTYLFEVLMDEYSPYYYTLTIDKIGRREFSRSLPEFVLTRAPRRLGEVTVVASKVKFYNRGDTLVFNADAFELAEGSMLDALVKQLPGVELKEGGQIYVNGEYVESLLLNGKDFFKGNNELLLDNLASYTVKNIEVYRKETDFDKWAGTNGKKDLVMDVKLKHEYNVGWMMNYEAGYGSADRYMARAFINRFTNNSRISLIGNINNLNDNRKPGESTTWTPATNTTGTMKTQLGGIDYFAQHQLEKWKVNGSAMVRHTSQNDWRYVDAQNLLNNGSSYYNYSYSTNKIHNLELSTNHSAQIKSKAVFNRLSLSGNYNKTTSDVSNIAASFRDEQDNPSREFLETLYEGNPTALDDIINRSRTETRNSGHSANGSFSYSGSVKIPGTPDNFSYGVGTSMSESKHEVWRDYLINYGTDPKPAVRENQYFDNSPNKSVSLDGNISYHYNLSSNQSLYARYTLTHTDRHQDSYMYALDRLGESGIIGQLPEGYLASFDASRSYRSHTVENMHEINLSYGYDRPNLWLRIDPTIRILDRNFDYFRAGTNHHVDQHHALVYMADYSTQLYLRLGKTKIGGRETDKNTLNFRVVIEPTMPDPVKMIDVTDTNDPLNIWAGNPDLKCSYTYTGKLVWQFRAPVGIYTFSNYTEVEYSNTYNALVNGYTFQESTGVRYNRTYNVRQGNYVAKLHVTPRLQFGSRGQFSAYYFGGVDYIHAADMIAVNTEAISPSSVYTWWQVHSLNFNWQLGKQQLGFRGEINGRYTGSDQKDFESINATNTTLAMTGQFRLPKGFGISTDFTVYMRRGYGEGIDSTDPVWNARLTYTPPRSKWVLMLDGFDMLHQLKSVNYAVNRQGRVITYTNVLPRYLMFHVQYKLHLQPKKKIIDTSYK